MIALCDVCAQIFQEERLRRLKHRMKVYFDASRPDHQVRFDILNLVFEHVSSVSS